MQTRLITVVETNLFLRQAQKIWSDEERGALVDHVARTRIVAALAVGLKAARDG